jgi:hypothetical protein
MDHARDTRIKAATEKLRQEFLLGQESRRYISLDKAESSEKKEMKPAGRNNLRNLEPPPFPETTLRESTEMFDGQIYMGEVEKRGK